MAHESQGAHLSPHIFTCSKKCSECASLLTCFLPYSKFHSARTNFFPDIQIIDEMTSKRIMKDTTVFYFETLNNTVILTLTNLRSYANINGNVCLWIVQFNVSISSTVYVKYFGWPSAKVSSMWVLFLMVLHSITGCFAQPKVG